METHNIANLFFEAAQRHPNKLAIIHGQQRITFKALEEDILRTAKYFKQHGLTKGDRVLIFVPMRIDLYRIVLALFSIGAVAVFLDEWVSKKRMELCCQIAQCKGFVGITKAVIFSWFSTDLRKIPIKLKIAAYKKYDVGLRHELILACGSEDTALITFTTGSTGTPKAAKRTHGFLKEQFNALIEEINPRVNDVDMPVLPIVLLINLGTGSTSVIVDYKASKPNKFKPQVIATAIKQHKVTRITSSPFFVKELSKFIVKQKLILESVEKIVTGGAPVFPKEAALYEKAFPDAVIQIVYGSTEAEPISSVFSKALMAEKETALTRGLLVGKPYHNAEVKIIPISDKPIAINTLDELVECKENQVGEIIVAGPHVLKEYFNNEVALKRNKIVVDGKVYHRTGDSGYINTAGILFLTGRCTTLFKQNEVYVCPFLWENYLQNIEGVEMGTVLLKDAKVTVVLELNDAALKSEVEHTLSASTLKWDGIVFIKQIPRDLRHNSKIDYEKLIEKLK